MTDERKKYLTFVKNSNFDVTDITMQEMLYWSKHNIYAYIEVIFTLRLKQLKK
jgi:hypothetical protein